MSSTLDDAVRHVLPALNLRPDGFRVPSGFVERALRRGRPSTYSLNDVTRQLVFIGEIADADPDAAAQAALVALGEVARDACTGLVVAWSDPGGDVRAAAFDVGGGTRALTGCSWLPPDAWPEPMIDASRSGDELSRTTRCCGPRSRNTKASCSATRGTVWSLRSRPRGALSTRLLRPS